MYEWCISSLGSSTNGCGWRRTCGVQGIVLSVFSVFSCYNMKQWWERKFYGPHFTEEGTCPALLHWLLGWAAALELEHWTSPLARSPWTQRRGTWSREAHRHMGNQWGRRKIFWQYYRGEGVVYFYNVWLWFPRKLDPLLRQFGHTSINFQ